MRWLSRYWPVVPLVLLALLARNWAEDAPDTIEVEETINMSETRSDYYLEDFTTRKFNESGDLQYRVSGSRLLHYPEDDRSEIIDPTVVLHRAGIRWDITSTRGELVRQPDTFTLEGDVLLERESEQQALVTIRTEQLSVRTDGNVVSTQKPIEVIADGWRLTAVGLQTSIDEGKLIFLSQVTGHYDVATPNSD